MYKRQISEYLGFDSDYIILGLAALTALLMLIKNFVGLSFSGDNPSVRKQKMISILFCGIATAGLGALTIFTGFFWNMLN